nr:hypothetical protein Iba_chr09bCG12760 [Ipomoea batatas]
MHLGDQTRKNLLLVQNHTMDQRLSLLVFLAFQHYITNLICLLHLYCTLTALIIGAIICQVRQRRNSQQDSCFHCGASHGGRWCDTTTGNLF